MDNYVAVNSDTLHEFQFNFFVFAMKVHEKTKAHQWRVFVMDTNMTKLLQSDRRYYFFFYMLSYAELLWKLSKSEKLK